MTGHPVIQRIKSVSNFPAIGKPVTVGVGIAGISFQPYHVDSIAARQTTRPEYGIECGLINAAGIVGPTRVGVGVSEIGILPRKLPGGGFIERF